MTKESQNKQLKETLLRVWEMVHEAAPVTEENELNEIEEYIRHRYPLFEEAEEWTS